MCFSCTVFSYIGGRRRRRGAKESKAERILRRGRRKILSPTTSSDDDVEEVAEITNDRSHGVNQPIKTRNRTGDKSNSDFSKLKQYNAIGRTTSVHQNESLPTGSSKLSVMENRTALRTNFSMMNSSTGNPRTAPSKQDESVTKNVTNSTNFKISLGTKQNDTSSRTSSSSADETAVNKVTLEERQKAERLKRQQEQQRLFRLKMEEKKRKMQQEQVGATHGSHNSTRPARVEQGSSHNASHVPTMQKKSSYSASSHVPATSSISKPTVQQHNAATSIGRSSMYHLYNVTSFPL